MSLSGITFTKAEVLLGVRKGVAHKFPLQNSKMLYFAYNSENGVDIFWKNILLRYLFYFCKRTSFSPEDSSGATKFIKTSYSFFPVTKLYFFSSLESVFVLLLFSHPFRRFSGFFEKEGARKLVEFDLRLRNGQAGRVSWISTVKKNLKWRGG